MGLFRHEISRDTILKNSFVAAFLVCLVLALFITSIQAQSFTQTFTSTADSYVRSDAPTTNYGSSTQFRVDGSPVVRSYVRFNVQNVTGTITKATLRVYANSAQNTGFLVHAASDSWEESTLRFDNAPAYSTVATGASGAVAANTWYSVPVTALVNGNGSYSFVLTTTASTAMSLASRESANDPQLIVEYETAMSTITPTLATVPTPTFTPTPTLGTGFSFIYAVGDMVPGAATQCGSSNCKQMQVSQLVLDSSPAAFLALGDVQYEEGSSTDFLNFYSPSFGRVKSITLPVVGNHEYLTPEAQGYFDYFNGAGFQSGQAGDRSKGYYATNVGDWRIYVLNSNCSKAGGCGVGSPQETWLKQDLEANPRECSLLAAHHPYVSSDSRDFSYYAQQRALWDAFYNNGGDVVLVGHSHFYERYAPMNPERVRDDAYGIRQFIVGTGGKNIYDIGIQQPLSVVWNGNTFGALKLTLKTNGYDWQFVPIPGQTFTDSGSSSCHGVPPLLTSTPMPTSTPPPSPIASQQVLTFTPLADAHVASDRPTTNYGSAAKVEVDGSPQKKILLTFNISGVGSSQIVRAKLRLYNVDASSMGGTFYKIANTSWQENTVTWNTAPVFDANSVAALGSVSPNIWYEIDVSSLINGDGLVSLGAVSASSNGADYASRESLFDPQLVVTIQ